MHIYNYERGLVDGSYNINNPLRKVDDAQIWLYQEITAAIPGNKFTIKCNCGGDPAKVEISFVTELTAGEQTMLDATVANHKNNT